MRNKIYDEKLQREKKREEYNNRKAGKIGIKMDVSVDRVDMRNRKSKRGRKYFTLPPTVRVSVPISLKRL